MPDQLGGIFGVPPSSRYARQAGDVVKSLANTLLIEPGWELGGKLQSIAEGQGTFGDYAGAGMDISGLVPAGAAAKAAPAMAALLGLGARRGIRAYHGSPHDFDRFDISKIGTGEGAQAYGHGLYFAEAPGVAESYKELAKKNPLVFSALTDKENKDLGTRFAASVWSGASEDSIRSAAKNLVRQTELDRAQALENYKISGASSFKEEADAAQRQLASLTKLVSSNDFAFSVPKGRMYEVNINAHPDQFLDWDRPLNAQSPQVNQQLSSILKSRDRSVEDWIRSSPGAESRMNEAGIPGIKYLDQGSRSAGQGSSNYVVFDDKLIDILKKYGIVAPYAGGPAAAALANHAAQQPGQVQ